MSSVNPLVYLTLLGVPIVGMVYYLRLSPEGRSTVANLVNPVSEEGRGLRGQFLRGKPKEKEELTPEEKDVQSRQIAEDEAAKETEADAQLRQMAEENKREQTQWGPLTAEEERQSESEPIYPSMGGAKRKSKGIQSNGKKGRSTRTKKMGSKKRKTKRQ